MASGLAIYDLPPMPTTNAPANNTAATDMDLQAGVEIRRRLGRLPFIQQRHGFLKVAQMGGTLGTGCDVFLDLRRRSVRAGGGCQVRQKFANLIAIHSFPLLPETNSFSCSRNVS